jgi:hypothetical protein
MATEASPLVCLSCRTGRTRSFHVVCRPCFKENEPEFRQMEASPWSPRQLKQKLWGQRFAKNRTPRNRCRIAFAAYVLSREGDDELLTMARRILLDDSVTTDAGTALEEPAKDISALEAALRKRNPGPVDKPGTFRTKDGHWVRSKSERDIANFLFDHRIAYQYERRVSFGDVDLHPDFFLPDVGLGLYLEHFGLLKDDAYKVIAAKKAGLFRRANLDFIATDEDDARDMEEALERKLAPFLRDAAVAVQSRSHAGAG